VFLSVLDFLAAIVSVVKVNNTATIATKEVNCFKYLNIILPFSYFYLLTNNSKLSFEFAGLKHFKKTTSRKNYKKKICLKDK
jgi:hypothetical protein